MKAEDSLDKNNYLGKPVKNNDLLLRKYKASKHLGSGMYGGVHKTPKGILKIDSGTEADIAKHIKDTKFLNKLKSLPKIFSAEHFANGGAIEREDLKNVNKNDHNTTKKVGALLQNAFYQKLFKGGRSGKRHLYTQFKELVKQDPNNKKLKQLAYDLKRVIHHGILPIDLEKTDNWGSRNGDLVTRDLGIWRTFNESPKRTPKQLYGNVSKQVNKLKRTRLESIDYKEFDSEQLNNLNNQLNNLYKKHGKKYGPVRKALHKGMALASDNYGKVSMPGNTWVRNKYRKLISNNNTKKAANLLKKAPQLLKNFYDRPEPSKDLKAPYEIDKDITLHKTPNSTQRSHEYDLLHNKKRIGTFEVHKEPNKKGIVKGSYIDAPEFKGKSLTPKIYATLAREHGGLESDDNSTSDAGYQIWKSLKKKGMADVLQKVDPITNKNKVVVNKEKNPRFAMPWHNIKHKIEKLKSIKI